MMKTRVFIVRHTETIGNVEKRLTGRQDYEITERGQVLIQKLTKELEKIKQEDKEIFIEYYYDDKNIKEISKKFNMTESKVKSKLFRVRKRLNKILKKRGYSSNEQ